MKTLLIFQNIHTVIKVEKIIEGKGIFYQIKPVPTSISSECGMCIEINNIDYQKVNEYLQQKRITFQQITLK